MDITIQSLVQSPYMRAMAVVPTKSEELVHGIHDHLPPLVKAQVRVQPVRNGGKTGRWVFNIPRRGMLHSAQLVVRPRLSARVLNAGIDSRQLGTSSTFVEAVENIELFSKQRFIERLVPEAICSEMLQYASKLEQWYQFTHADYNPTTNVFLNPTGGTLPFPYVGNTQLIAGLDTLAGTAESWPKSCPHYIIPLPFSCFTSIKKNFQTLFVETLSVVVTAKDFGYFGVGGVSSCTGYDMELVCDYHSFHPNVETVIRNANYKQTIPATLPWHDWIVFDNRISSTASKIEYSLESDALISKLLVIPQRPHTLSGVKTTTLTQNLYIVVRSLSEILFEGSVASLRDQRDLILDETDSQGFPEIANDISNAFYIPITFGLRRDQERFTGGLALSSITNPRIEVYPSEQVYAGASALAETSRGFPATAGYDAFDVKILGKRHFFLRIDSDTGVITRSIES